MGTMDIQLFAVSDNRPINRDLFAHDAELYKRAELANHVQALLNRCRVAGSLDVDIAAVPIGEIAHFLNDVILRRIQADIGSASFGDLQPIVAQVERDDPVRPFHLCSRYHSEAKWAATRNHDGVLIVYLGSFNRMKRAGQGFDENCVVPWHRLRHLVVQGTRREHHVVGPRAKRSLAETVDIMHGAHPIGASPAIAAFPAWHDLLADCVIADLQSILIRCAFTKGNNFTDELMARGHRGLTIARPMSIAPEQRRSGITLDITGADPGALHSQYDFARPRLRNAALLHSVIFRTITHHC